eukprot:3163485-Rhodomonas_salina.1
MEPTATDQSEALPARRRLTPSTSFTREKTSPETITNIGLFSISSKGGCIVTRRENFVLIVELPDHEISLKSGEMVVIKPARLRSVTTCVDSTIFSDGNGVSETVWSADGRCHHTNEFEAIELDDNKFALAVTNFPLSRVEARGIRSSRDKLRAKCLNDAKQAQIDAMKDMEPTWEEKP